jgi:uncharacterized protein YecT (DUF1311 family)
MSYVKNTITLLLSIFIVNVSFSQVERNVHRLDEVYTDCCNKNHGEYGAANCAIDLSKKWDEEMNKYYKGLMNILDASAQKDLKQAQDQWTKYRDLESKFSSSLHDMQGTMYIRLAAYRSMRIIRTRALELKSYYWTRTEEEEPKNTSLNNLQIITQESISDTVLPTPDSKFMNSLDESRRINAEYVIDKYLEAYFYIVEPEKVIRRTDVDNPEYPEGPVDCGFRTVYNKNVILEDDFGCESYTQSTTIQFSNYSYKEVNRVVKLLLPEVYKKDASDYTKDQGGWHNLDGDDEWYEYGGSCSLSISKRNNKTFIDYVCG